MILVSKILIGLGLFFFMGTAVGLVRFPDFYTRMHAAGKSDTLSTLLMLIGLALYNLHDVEHLTVASVLVSAKIFLIVLFIYIGSPTATHAITHAGHKMGISCWKRPKSK